MQNHYNPGKLLKQMFPEQTKSNLHIIIWTIVFIADLVGMYFLLEAFGISWLHNRSTIVHEFYLLFLIGGGLFIFWLETFIYNKLHSLFR